MRVNKHNKRKFKHEESDICKSLWEWFFYAYPKFRDCYLRFEVRQSSKIMQIILKAEGNKRGTSDVLIVCSNDQFKGLWLEVKTKIGRVTDSQTKFQIHMSDQGYGCGLGYGLKECQEIIRQYMETVPSPLNDKRTFAHERI